MVAFHSTSVLFQQSFDAEKHTYDSARTSVGDFTVNPPSLLFPRNQRGDTVSADRGRKYGVCIIRMEKGERDGGERPSSLGPVSILSAKSLLNPIFPSCWLVPRPFTKGRSVPLEITGARAFLLCCSRRRIERQRGLVLFPPERGSCWARIHGPSGYHNGRTVFPFVPFRELFPPSPGRSLRPKLSLSSVIRL